MDQSLEPSPYSTVISDRAQESPGHSCLSEPHLGTQPAARQEWAGPQKAAGAWAGGVQRRRLMLPKAGPRARSPLGRPFYFLHLSFFFFGLIPFFLSLYLLPTELNITSLYLLGILSELSNETYRHIKMTVRCLF